MADNGSHVAAAFGLGDAAAPMTPEARGAMGEVSCLTTASDVFAAKRLFAGRGTIACRLRRRSPRQPSRQASALLEHGLTIGRLDALMQAALGA